MKIDKYQFPDELYYDQDHCWIRQESELLVMGMDDFGQKMAGEIVFVQLPVEGKRLSTGKTVGKVESGKWLGKVASPVNGVLEEVNEELEISPQVINQDCYGQGWLYKIRPDSGAALAHLHHGQEDMEAWMQEELKKYADKR